MNKFNRTWAGEQAMFKQNLQMLRFLKYNHLVGIVVKRALVYAENGYIEHYIDDESIAIANNDGKKLLTKEIGKELIEGHKNITKRFWLTAKKVRNNVDNLSLSAHFNSLKKLLVELFAYFFTSTAFVTHHLEKTIRKSIINESDFLTLITSTDKDILYNEKKSWLKVLKNPNNLKKHMLNFPFLFPNIDSETDAIKLMQDKLKSDSIDNISKSIKETNDYHKQVKKKQKELYKQINNKKLEQHTKLLRELSHRRLQIKECWSGMHYYLLPLYNKLSEWSKTPVRDIMMYYTVDEMQELIDLKNLVPKKEISNRKLAYMYLLENQQIRFYSGDNALKAKDKYLKENFEGIKSIKGTIASKGKLKGKVMLLKSDDLRVITKKAKQATKKHILVVGNTNPNMMILLNKIGGIVTEEGGITSHASVISRELNIPCIIGTKTATKIFKEDELIELDADKGIARKL